MTITHLLLNPVSVQWILLDNNVTCVELVINFNAEKILYCLFGDLYP